MSSSSRRLPSSDPLYILGLLTGTLATRQIPICTRIVMMSILPAPSLHIHPLSALFRATPTCPTSSFQSSDATVTPFQSSPLQVALLSPSPTLSSNSCTSSFQSYPVLPSTGSFQSYPVLSSTSSSQKSPHPLPPPIPFRSSVQASSCSLSAGT